MKSNISESIQEKIGRNLYLQDNHPIKIVKEIVYDYFLSKGFDNFDIRGPEVSIEENFDFLRIPKDHPGRRVTDTYYKDENTVLRTHMTCTMKKWAGGRKSDRYVACGDVYRKDTVDATHFPVFHQIDGFEIVVGDPMEKLKNLLGGLVDHLFPGKDYRFAVDEFPFTDPSIEVEVNFNGEWLEILGGGVVHSDIMKSMNYGDQKAIAFGLGLERIAMIIYDIKDIRLFWSKDERFLNQFKEDEDYNFITDFKEGKLKKFMPYSKYPEMKRDVSMWVPDEYHEHDFYDIVRNVGGDLVENVELFDVFENKKRETKQRSFAFHLVYRSNDRTLTDDEVNEIHSAIESKAVEDLGVEIR